MLLATESAFAAKKAPAKRDDAWQSTFALMEEQKAPIAQKLITWLYVTESRLPLHAPELMDFVRANSHWPRMHEFKEKIEASIEGSLPPAEIIAWFGKYAPETHDGAKAYIKALLAQKQAQDAKDALQKFWRDARLKKNEAASLAGSYPSLLSKSDHNARLDALIWAGRYAEAEYMLAFAAPDHRALGHARLLLAKLSSKSDTALAAVPSALQNDEGLLFERLRYRRRKDMDDGAIEILNKMPKISPHKENWWQEINILARREIEKKNYGAAYALAKQHGLSEGIEYAQAEWLLGWLALRGLNDPAKAYPHFDVLYRNVQSAISKSRAAYWAARTAEALADRTLTDEWDKIAALYPSTFYGQLSYTKLGGTPSAAQFAEKPVTPEVKAAFDKSDLVQAARLLHKLDLDQFIDPFLAKLLADAKSGQDYYLIAKLARETKRPYYIVETNKQAQQTVGVFLMNEGYPLLPSLPASEPEKSLVHAIVYRESMFDPNAVSNAGARGLMQVMPATGKMLAKQKGRKFSVEKLTQDPQFNVALGSAYLQQMIDNYGGFYPMGIAAYNGGPGRVAEWIETFGDPRKGDMDVIDWIEHIPIYETRNYVQRVMEAYYMYRLRFGLAPKTAYDFMQR